MTQIRYILFLCTMICLPIMANAQNEGNSSSPVVLVDKYNDAYRIFAKGEGVGPTLEFAKFAAINSILPQLVCETSNLPGASIQNIISRDGVVKGQGIDRILAKTSIEGYWQLEDSVYRYTIKLMMRNESEKKENK